MFEMPIPFVSTSDFFDYYYSLTTCTTHKNQTNFWHLCRRNRANLEGVEEEFAFINLFTWRHLFPGKFVPSYCNCYLFYCNLYFRLVFILSFQYCMSSEHSSIYHKHIDQLSLKEFIGSVRPSIHSNNRSLTFLTFDLHRTGNLMGDSEEKVDGQQGRPLRDYLHLIRNSIPSCLYCQQMPKILISNSGLSNYCLSFMVQV